MGIRLRHGYAKQAFYDTWVQVYRWLISYITPLSDGTPMNIRMYFIFLENKSPGLHFAADNIGLSLLKSFWWAPEFLFTLARGRFHRSRASKVTDIGANQKRWADFLLVRNSNFGPILHRFWARARFMCSSPHPYSTLILGVFPLHQIAHVGRQRAHGP